MDGKHSDSTSGGATATPVGRLIEIASLTALAIAYPIFDLLRQNPEFFVARNSRASHVVGLVLVLSVVVPLTLAGVQRLVELLAGERAGRWTHAGVLFALTAALVMPWCKRFDVLGSWPAVAVAMSAGAVLALAYSRRQAIRSFVRLLAPAILVVPAFFLSSAGVWGAVVRADAEAAPPSIGRVPTIVVVVFDEFPLNSLLDDAYGIDEVRYPHFAALARTGTWFRNASTVSSQTAWAVPAIVSGKYPVASGAVPTHRYYPNNLFTMLRERYDMTVFGRFLQLCPQSDCVYDLEVPAETLRSLIADLAIVYLHVALPDSLAATLPPIVGDWRGFATARRFRDADGQRTRNDRAEEFDRFLATIGPAAEGRLYFLHTMLPHMPFAYVPSGKAYDGPDYQGTREGGSPLFEQAGAGLANAVHQRHLLQVGFVDTLVGRLLDRLEQQGILDESLLILTADHGASHREGVRRRNVAEANYADILLVPLLMKLPGQRRGFISDRNVETVDILPTVADVLSIDLPFLVDGTSLLDFDAPDRSHKTFVERSLARSLITHLGDGVDNSYVAWERKLATFGARTQEGMYAVGFGEELLGTDVVSFRSSSEAGFRAVIEDADAFETVEKEASVLPLLVHGEIVDDDHRPTRLAIALNGVIAATTTSYRESDEWRFASLVPEGRLRQGANEVRIFAVEQVGTETVLRPVR